MPNTGTKKGTGPFSEDFVLVIGVIMCGLVGWLGVYAGNEFSFVVLYLVPALLVAWFSGVKGGLFISFFSALTWLIGDIIGDRSYTAAYIPYVNALSRMLLYAIITTLAAVLRKQLLTAKKTSNEDFLTKISNSRAFFNYASMEVERLKRYKAPFTIVYFDVDDFKGVNDNHGHNAGDALLVGLARAIRNHIRPTDVVARMGGDEFAILLLETNPEQARTAVGKLDEVMRDSMKSNGMNITFSIGVVTFLTPPKSMDELVRLADEMMYLSKKGGKNSVNYSVYNQDKKKSDTNP